MLTTLSVVLPIFALIFTGWLARRSGVLGPAATGELNRFVVYLALPALLFDIVAHASWAELWQPGFIAAFGLGGLLVFAGVVLLRLRGARPLADATLDGLNAGYANTGFMGFPLALVALGRGALAATLVATLLTACVLFGVAIVLIELGLQEERERSRVGLKVGGSLLRNPLVLAPVLGAFVPLAGLTLPAPAETFLKLLGGAASPCALVTIGLFLAAPRGAAAVDVRSTGLLVGCKLAVQPGIAWFLSSVVFGLSPLLTHTAVLLSALPTGTGPFILAELYGREADVTSDAILASTVVSVLTVSGYLAWTG